MNRLANLALSVGETLVHEAGRLLFGIALGRAKQLLDTPQPLGTRQLALNRAFQKKAVDGALLAGPGTGKKYAKFTLKKGLPTDQRPRTLAVENQPHSVDDFNGIFEEGYGKGEKRLIYSGTGVIKVGGSCQLERINVHEHDAQKARESSGAAWEPWLWKDRPLKRARLAPSNGPMISGGGFGSIVTC